MLLKPGPTGYGRGRPRKGEVRPLTFYGVQSARVRAKRIAEDPDTWYAKQAEYQREWRKDNYDRRKEQERNAYLRAKAWTQVDMLRPCMNHVDSAKHYVRVNAVLSEEQDV